MAKPAVSARSLEHFTEGQGPEEEKRKAKDRARVTGLAAFEGKVFADLSSQEKDDILKTLAIAAGLIIE